MQNMYVWIIQIRIMSSVWSVTHASFIIILTCICKNYVRRCMQCLIVACAQSGFMESMCTVKNEMPFTREIADQSTFIGACCNTDGH